MLTAPLRRLTRNDVPFSWGPEEKTAFEKLKASITSEDTMAFFDPLKPIVVRTEASFHEGLQLDCSKEKKKGYSLYIKYVDR